jgi:site-specific recombinase XerD
LRAIGRSPRTIETYAESVGRLVAHVKSPDLVDYTPDAMRGWLIYEQEGTAPGSVGVRYRSVRAFMNWLVAEDEIGRSPMSGIPHPKQDDKPPPVLSITEVRRLLDATDGKDWRSRRDRALLLFMVDTGARRGEVAGIRMEHVDLDVGEVRISGKTGTRIVSIGDEAVAAMDRWVRARAKLPAARHSDAVWISDHKALTDEGIRQILKRLGNEAGVKVAPHQLRHTASHLLRVADMGDAELMALMGWRSPAMLHR